MMHRDDIERLIDAALTAWRPQAPDGLILPHPAWADLDDGSRVELFERTLAERIKEAAIDPEDRSSTVRKLLGRIREH